MGIFAIDVLAMQHQPMAKPVLGVLRFEGGLFLRELKYRNRVGSLSLHYSAAAVLIHDSTRRLAAESNRAEVRCDFCITLGGGGRLKCQSVSRRRNYCWGMRSTSRAYLQRIEAPRVEPVRRLTFAIHIVDAKTQALDDARGRVAFRGEVTQLPQQAFARKLPHRLRRHEPWSREVSEGVRCICQRHLRRPDHCVQGARPRGAGHRR
mmetsp:Transcript_47030/g.93149  ORF Transcript_47030/g.93149 Transcript_47030/m.93149 type:complete len:207 (+) Transcript_47030:129-749(+)